MLPISNSLLPPSVKCKAVQPHVRHSDLGIFCLLWHHLHFAQFYLPWRNVLSFTFVSFFKQQFQHTRSICITAHCSSASFARFLHPNWLYHHWFSEHSCIKPLNYSTVLSWYFLPFAEQLFQETPPSSAPSSGWHSLQRSQNWPWLVPGLSPH